MALSTRSFAVAQTRSSATSTGLGLPTSSGARCVVPARRQLWSNRPRPSCVTRVGLEGHDLMTLHEGMLHTMGGLEHAFYTIASVDAVAAAGDAVAAAGDAVTAAGDAADSVASEASKSTGVFNAFADVLEEVLQWYQTKLDAANVPYSYGWSIVLLTLTIKIATFPLTKKQVESSMAVQNLRPRLEAIKARYEGDDDRIKEETNLLYKRADVNPLAGCLPSIATIPIFIGLYRSLSNAAEEGVFNSQGFYWVPSLAGPTSVAARKAGTSTDWLFPFVDGHPPIGWHDASLYLVFPVLVVAAQFWSASILKNPDDPQPDPDDDNAQTTAQLLKLLPLMVGWFSLNVPSGLTLYYFSNTVLTAAQQVFLRKLGGVQIDDVDLGPIKNLGSARRNGAPVSEELVEEFLGQPPVLASDAEGGPDANATASPADGDVQPEAVVLQRRSKRKRQLVNAAVEASKATTVTVTAQQAVENEFPAF